MNIHNDQKKLILNKLFKGGQIKGQVNYQGVNSSFNEQLMNQTNFGFNPARQTIVSTPNGHSKDTPSMIFADHMATARDRRELNTQKRNRT